MLTLRSSRILRSIPPLVVFCLVSFPAQAKYSGGTGEPNDPYQIATAADLIALGDTPDDYDKHFILTADIDLDPNLPGRKVFDKAVIAPDTDNARDNFQGTPFSGVFDGNGHRISHLTIIGAVHLGLFGRLDGEIRNLGTVDVNIVGSDAEAGGLVGYNNGALAHCYSTGSVSGTYSVGGLVGTNERGVTDCYSTGTVSGTDNVGGLVGYINSGSGNIAMSYSTGAVSGGGWGVGGLVGGISYGIVTYCYRTGAVDGNDSVGGLAGYNSEGTVNQCYSSGAVSGNSDVGGLVGVNVGEITNCYSTSTASGGSSVGGLVGVNCVQGETIWLSMGGAVARCYSTGAVSGNGAVGGLVGSNRYGGGEGIVSDSFWDTRTSGQATSDGGTGKTTLEMQNIQTYQDAGWDLVGEIGNGTHEIWHMPEGASYPVVAILSGYIPPQLEGHGSADSPYLIFDAFDLGAVAHYSPSAHYRLAASIDLSGIRWRVPVILQLDGTFDGNGHTISNLTITGGSYLGLFGRLGYRAEVTDLGVVDVNIVGSGDYVGGLVGNNMGDHMARCYSTGAVSGDGNVGGLVGGKQYGGSVAGCFSTCAVSGIWYVGGLVGSQYGGTVTYCYSTSTVSGTGDSVGGLVGWNSGAVTQCDSTGLVSGAGRNVGGLVGSNTDYWGEKGIVSQCFWDIQTSGQTTSAGGTGKTTAEMQTARTFLDAGWDFVGETANGTEDIWWILEGKDYPRLWWETHNN